MRTYFVQAVSSAIKDNTDVVYIPRSGAEVDKDIVVPEQKENQTFPTTDYKEIKQNSSDVRTNWDNEVVPDGPWYDKKLFGDVTAGQVAIGTVILIVIITTVVLVCMYISWTKRKAIAEGARRLSSSIRRSISGKSNSGVAPKDDKTATELVDPKSITSNPKEQELLKDMFADQKNNNAVVPANNLDIAKEETAKDEA